MYYPQITQIGSRFSSQRTASVRTEFRGQLDPFRFAPQTFKVVKLPCLLFKNMNYKIAVIQKDPLGRLVTFNSRGAVACLLESLVNPIGNRLHLPFVCTTDDHKVVGEARDLTQV